MDYTSMHEALVTQAIHVICQQYVFLLISTEHANCRASDLEGSNCVVLACYVAAQAADLSGKQMFQAVEEICCCHHRCSRIVHWCSPVGAAQCPLHCSANKWGMPTACSIEAQETHDVIGEGGVEKHRFVLFRILGLPCRPR
jgi:hypothetical protein